MSSPSISTEGEGTEALAPDTAALFEQALALEQAGRHADAEAAYRALLAQQPGSAAVLHNLALLLRSQGRLAEAEALARDAIRADASKATFHNTLGVILRQLGRWEESEAAYRQALALWKGYPDAHFNLGLLLELGDKPADAARCYHEATRLKPDYVQAHTRLASLLQRSGQVEGALAALDAAATATPDSFEVEYYRAGALSALRRHDEALKAVERAASLRPDSFEAVLATANTLREAGRTDEALAAYWRALELRPDRLATHEELNRLAWTAARRDLYLRSFAWARERRGPDPELLQLEAAFHMRREGFVAAETLLREARTLAPGRGDVAGLLARALAGQGRYEESYPLFVEAINTDRSPQRHRIEFGFALLRDGQPSQALAIFDGALKASPFDQLVLAGLSVAYRQLDDSRHLALVDFARYVRVYDLQGPAGMRDAAQFNRQLAEELQSLHTATVEPIEQTLRGGTQTTGRLFEERLPMVQHLRGSVEDAVADYVKQLEPGKLHPVPMRKAGQVRFAGSWSCRLKSGGYHHNHVHPQGWLSSAYYVRLPEHIHDSVNRPGWLKFGESNLGLGERDVPLQAIKPQVGRLVLFPSYFWHGTVPFADIGDRLAVAFDVAPGKAAAAEPASAGDLHPATLA